MIERLFIFAKAQLSSFFGGMVDYCTMILITEYFHIHYTFSIAISGIIGAVVNFSINQNWTFKSKKTLYRNPTGVQVFRFILVVLNSIILKASGTYLLTHYWNIDYKYSRIIVDLTVSWAFNYMLQRHWVFKGQKK